MEIIKNLGDDEILIQACKKLYRTFTFYSHPTDMDEGTVDLRHEEFERLIELAEIGKNVIQGNTCEIVENKREEDVEHSEELPSPHFEFNKRIGADCNYCLCSSCTENCVDCDLEHDACIGCPMNCAENCANVKNVKCKEHYYVDSCPAYNDGHNF